MFQKVKKSQSHKSTATTKASKDVLKRSFEKYLASDKATPKFGRLFVPELHLAYEEPKCVHSMEDLGYSANNGVSPVAVSEPFRLFSEDAVNFMREEIFAPVVQQNYAYSSDIAPVKQLRGYAPEYVRETLVNCKTS